ncbi:hypothetical protein [Citrobacter amalonaticus]|uniref:hypothetical protein n=1 Tax=Citrobacter amalonaticus TaxID=35703 RepID=UPI00331496DC
MTTITRERLLKIQQWRETYGPGSNVVLPAEEAEELARIALASLEAEIHSYTFEDDPRPLYTAPLAPVVPDAYIPDEHRRMMLNGQCETKIGFAAGWNACRAAMLNQEKSNG